MDVKELKALVEIQQASIAQQSAQMAQMFAASAEDEVIIGALQHFEEDAEAQLQETIAIFRSNSRICQQIVSSSVGALITSLIVTPMDVVKIRLQQQIRPLAPGQCFLYSNGLMDHICLNCEEAASIKNNAAKCEWFNRPGHFTGTVDALAKIARNEGIRSLWSGLSPTMLSAIPATVFYFTVYDNTFCYLRKRLSDRFQFYVPLISGSFARTVAVTVVSPLELIRTKMQSESFHIPRAIKRTVVSDGYSSLWRGWTATLMRDIPFSAIYWTAYELFKKRLLSHMDLEKTNFTISFISGAAAGTIAAIVTIPFDVIKTHQQITLGQTGSSQQMVSVKENPSPKDNKMQSTRQILKDLVRSKGVSSLFTGLVPRIARVAPACAIMIGSYEYLKGFFNQRNKKQRMLNE
uniref:Solute carrier family 25 member 40 n=1 Tax=Ditylenchus dipsaci TaxID=166011 RepID=A0A915DSA8_9BILA